MLAPSSHNTQPWIFAVGDSCIRVYADRARALPVNDPEDRELVISCGCAIMNLRVGAAHEGLATEVALPRAAHDDDLMAEILLSERTPPKASEAELFPFVHHRRTYRRAFQDRDLDQATLERLSTAAMEEGATFEVLDEEAKRQQVARLVAEGNVLQWANSRWRRELAAWMHPRKKGHGLTVPGFVAPVARAVVRRFDMGNSVAANDAQLADESPLIAAIQTQHDDPQAWLSAGQALERVLLTACAAGVQASYLNQPNQVSALRPPLQNLLEIAGFPQILLRIR